MFRLLGFDVKVQTGFVVFMVLIVFLYGNEFGLWLAGALAVFTIVHELGHALAARGRGAQGASISLGFLAGYASYRPTRSMTRLDQMWISFAGPAAHIALSSALLLALGVNPLDGRSSADTDPTLAIWWAGPVIGVINLIPILPLDGGNIVTYGLDHVLPGKARRYMLYVSIAATVAGAAWVYLVGYQGFAIFIAFLLLTQFQMLGAGKPRQAPRSPWDLAVSALREGRPDKARRTLVAALRHPQPFPSGGKLSLSRAEAEALVDLLPRPLPHGDADNEVVLAQLLILVERWEDAAHYAAESYGRHPSPRTAAIVARAANALGDHATADAWIETAQAN